MTRLIPTSHAPAALTLTGYSPPTPDLPDATASVGDLWRILWRRRFMIVATAGVLFVLTLIYCIFAPPLYTASSEIIIDPRDRQVVVNDVNPSGVAPDGGVTQIESQARVIESSSVLLRAIAATNLTADPDFNGNTPLARLLAMVGIGTGQPRTEQSIEAKTLRSLKRRLAVKRADKVFVIEVIVSAHAADKAARLANAIADAYLVDQANAKAQAGERASAALSARLDAQRTRVEATENAIQAFKEANNIVTAGGQLVGDQKLIDLSAQLTAAQSRTSALRAKIDQIEGVRQSRGTVDATAEVMQSTVIAKLREQEGTLVQRQAELAAQFGPQHPAIANIRSQLANVRQLISVELNRITTATQADYERALSDERMLGAQVQRARASSTAVGQASVRLREMERDLEAQRTVYAAFLVRAQETREQSSIDTTNARVITRATPPEEKSWPPLGLLLAGAVGSGVGLGSGLALIREYARPTILAIGQVERAVGAPVIAVLPGNVIARAQAAPGNRAVAMIGLALRRLFDSDPGGRESSPVRSLLITSGAADGAARRAVCNLFASAAVRRGDRVLLVDGDLTVGGTGGAPGLRQVLRGDSKLDAVVDHAASSGLVRLGPGGDASAASGDAGWSAARRMLAEARDRFDLLVIDGGVLAENLSVAPLLAAADEVLLVGQLARTTQLDVSNAIEAASIMGRPVSAVVLVDPMATA